MSNDLEITIHIAAKPETVFRYLSDPELFKQWMGPGAMLSPKDVVVHYPTGEVARGALHESVANERIVFGWGYDDGRHGLKADATTVTIQLAVEGDGTRVTLKHAGLDEAQKHEHAKGWTHYLSQLGASVSNAVFNAALTPAVESYVAAWNETDLSKRATLLENCWEQTGAFRDSMGVAEGREALLHYISGAQQFVPGFRLEQAGAAEQCHGYYRFPWLIRLPDGSVMGRGSNFGQIAASGKLALAIGFWDKG